MANLQLFDEIISTFENIEPTDKNLLLVEIDKFLDTDHELIHGLKEGYQVTVSYTALKLRDKTGHRVLGLSLPAVSKVRGNILNFLTNQDTSRLVENLRVAIWLVIGHHLQLKSWLKHVTKSCNRLKQEDAVINSIRQDLKRTGEISLKVGNDTVKIDGVQKCEGTPKADFSLTYKEVPIVWLSHKTGEGSQQWGGITSQALGEHANHPEVIHFTSMMSKLQITTGINSMIELKRCGYQSTFAIPVCDSYLKAISIFGKDAVYKPNGKYQYNANFGVNNVQAVIKGKPIFTKGKSSYNLDASFRMIWHPVTTKTWELHEEDEPYLMAYPSKDRNGVGCNMTQCRMVITHKKRAGNYTASEKDFTNPSKVC